MPNGVPFREGYFPRSVDVFIECPVGDSKYLQCQVFGAYNKDVSYALMFPKTAIFSYENYIKSAMRLFRSFDVLVVQGDFNTDICENNK